jgi:hypothetical protein
MRICMRGCIIRYFPTARFVWDDALYYVFKDDLVEPGARLPPLAQCCPRSGGFTF